MPRTFETPHNRLTLLAAAVVLAAVLLAVLMVGGAS